MGVAVPPRAGVFKIDWILSEPVPWTNPDVRRAGTIHVAGTLEETIAGERAPTQGRLTDKPYVLAVQPTVADPTRAPEGGHIFWAYVHVPHGSDADMTEAIEAQIERFAPGFRDTVVERATKNAVQMEQWNPNYLGGDISNGAGLAPADARPAGAAVEHLQDAGPRRIWPRRPPRPARRCTASAATTPPGSRCARCSASARSPAAPRRGGGAHRSAESTCRHVDLLALVDIAWPSCSRPGRPAPAGSVPGMVRPLGLPFDPIERAGETWEERFGPASAMRAATSVFRVQQILLARFDEVLKPHGLTFARYEVLVLLTFSRTGELPLKVIGSRLMVHPTSVTNAIDRLVGGRLRRPAAQPERRPRGAGRDHRRRTAGGRAGDGGADRSRLRAGRPVRGRARRPVRRPQAGPARRGGRGRSRASTPR